MRSGIDMESQTKSTPVTRAWQPRGEAQKNQRRCMMMMHLSHFLVLRVIIPEIWPKKTEDSSRQSSMALS
jgi:hypothetical protein